MAAPLCFGSERRACRSLRRRARILRLWLQTTDECGRRCPGTTGLARLPLVANVRCGKAQVPPDRPWCPKRRRDGLAADRRPSQKEAGPRIECRRPSERRPRGCGQEWQASQLVCIRPVAAGNLCGSICQGAIRCQASAKPFHANGKAGLFLIVSSTITDCTSRTPLIRTIDFRVICPRCSTSRAITWSR